VVERILHTLGYDLGLQPRVTFREVPGEPGARSFLVPDQLWRVDPPDCFAPLTIRDSDGTRRTFDLLDRDGRVAAYAWLLRYGDETQLFTHLDGSLLVDAWPDVAPHLTESLRSCWRPLVLSAGEGWLDEYLRAGLQEGRPKSVSRQTRARAIQQLADRGLTADEIRRVLRRR
jgi:hypothetical protein